MINQSGPDGCTEQTSGLDLLVGVPRAHSVRMGASCASARGALYAHVYSIQIRVQDSLNLMFRFYFGECKWSIMGSYGSVMVSKGHAVN